MGVGDTSERVGDKPERVAAGRSTRPTGRPTSPTEGSTSSTGKPPEEGLSAQLITQRADGLWLAMCDEEDCDFQKVYPTQLGAQNGLNRHKRNHKPKGAPEEEKAGDKEKPGEERGPPKPDISKMQPREIVAFYGPEGLDMLKRQRLAEFLSIAPGVGDKIAQWILKQWDTDTNIRRSVNNLFSVLTSSGLRNEMAGRIANMIYTMDEEYQEMLNKPQVFVPGAGGRQQTGPAYSWPETPRQQPQQGWVWNQYAGRYEWAPTQPQTQGPPPTQPPPSYYYPPPSREPEREREGRYLTTEKAEEMFRRIVKEQAEADKLAKMEAAVVGLGSDLDNLTKRLESGELGGRRREEEESPATKELKGRLDKMEEHERELTKSLHEAERAVDKKEADHLRQELDRTHSDIEALRRDLQLGAGTKTVEGYKEDSMRVVGQGMQTIAGVAQTRRPAETIAGYIFGVPPGQPTAPPPESLGGLAGRLPQRFVTRVQ